MVDRAHRERVKPRWRQSGRAQLDRLGLEGRLELAIGRAVRERAESWEQAAARLVMNEVAFRALLADVAADDPYAVDDPYADL